MTKKEAVDYIECQTWSTTRLGLDRTRELLSGLGDPQKKLKFIHVAGSNGKGSTCAMLSSVLIKAGYKCGLYISPYLSDFSEQLSVNNIPISEEDLSKQVSLVKPVAEAMEDHPSRFEILTAVGMLYFLDKGCDVVVLEVGMGGELDSTNVIDSPLVSVIANIGMEHTEYLGNTIQEIASTKAGIIKPNSVAVCYDSTPEAVSIVREKAKKTGSEFILCDFEAAVLHENSLSGIRFSYKAFQDVFVPLIGRHQMKNALLVLETVEVLRKKGFDISLESLYEGLSVTNWPARFEVLREDPLYILDGAHNPQCVSALRETLDEVAKGMEFTFLCGMLKDKDYRDMLQVMLPLANEVICVSPENPRALSGEGLEDAIGDIREDLPCKVFFSIEEAVEYSLTKPTVLAFGSLYLAGDVRSAFQKLTID